MRVFKSKWFAKFSRKERITDAKLCEAVKNAEHGFIDADYGDGVITQPSFARGRKLAGLCFSPILLLTDSSPSAFSHPIIFCIHTLA